MEDDDLKKITENIDFDKFMNTIKNTQLYEIDTSRFKNDELDREMRKIKVPDFTKKWYQKPENIINLIIIIVTVVSILVPVVLAIINKSVPPLPSSS